MKKEKSFQKSEKKKIERAIYAEETYPIFCFKYLSGASIKKCKDAKILSDFLMRLQKLSTLEWEGIRKSNRHGYGMEKIPTKAIKPKLPSIISPEVKELDVFRFTGNNLPFIGKQDKSIFRVFFIETSFGDIYNH